jgi:hypothetical protein
LLERSGFLFLKMVAAASRPSSGWVDVDKKFFERDTAHCGSRK